MNKQALNSIGSSLDHLAEITSIAYVEITQQIKDQIVVVYNKNFNKDFKPLSFDELKGRDELKKTLMEGELVVLDQSSDEGVTAHCIILPLYVRETSFYLSVQSKAEIFETDREIVHLAGRLITASGQYLFSDQENGDSKYKEEMMKMRNAQARLFPKFEDLKGIDVSAIYLPSGLMTGDFVDAFYLNREIYQIVACDIAGEDASSSFAGAAVRTLVRSYSSAATMPSALLEILVKRVTGIIQGVQSLMCLTVYHVNTRTGKTTVSSFGDINTVFYSVKKKGYIHLNTTETGKNLAKKMVYKDISLMLDPGDLLLFYTSGVTQARDEKSNKPYGEERLIANFKEAMDSPPLEIVHSLSESIYEFTDYSNPKEDIILLCLKREIPK